MKILVYLFPMLINYIQGGMFFINAYRFSEGKAGSVVVGLALGAWAGIYCLASLIVGRITTGRNAPKLICTGALLIAAAALGFIVLDGLYTQFVWIVLTGIGAALFCSPFQVFMRSLEQPGNSGVVRAAALYTFSWSFGMACGPFVFGLFSARTGFTLNILLALAVAAGVVLADRFARRAAAPPQYAVNAASPAPVRDFAWVGWLVGGIGVVTVCQIRSMWPFRGAELHFTKTDIGLVLALVSLVQGLMALALIRSRSWMGQSRPALAVGATGAAGLLLFAFGRTLPLFYLGAVIYGVYSGAFFFFLVYHALANPSRAARNVAGNEAVVGITSIAGPLLGGWVAQVDNASAPFWLAALLAVGTSLVPAAVFRRNR